ncbi:PR domain zinc finger protein 10-like [Contarinia nasturtii]|uniref:PR domain zinc finger protein 10-like n=1 Tax=Contarinia nasturtii TaxID=265458 RepID=UPI0012D4C0A1|nr:PR domain zinc finger protein 10-like [Contarinia nasturtii]
MDISNSNGKSIQVDPSMEHASHQYVFADHFKTFDPNMCSAAEYSPPPPSVTDSNAQQTTVIAPYHAIPSNYNELTDASDISLVPVSETTSNCITYSNIIFVPSMTNNGNHMDSIGDAIELVKDETNIPPGIELGDPQSIKYIVSSDSQLLNTFIRPNDLDNVNAVLNHNPNEEYIVNTDSQIDNNLVLNETHHIQQHLNDVESMDKNQIAIHQINQINTGNDQEILMQDENGHLYRHVQNILIDGTSMCPNELLPILSAPVDLADPDYVEQSISRIQSTFNQRENTMHDLPFQIPINFITNPESNQTIPVSSKSMDTSGLDMQHVEFILNNENTNVINNSNQYGTQSNVNILNDNTNYQCHPTMQSNDSSSQRFLESTMSTLLAAVNDITARDEQFQQYLNTIKSPKDHSIDYYTDAHVENHVDNIPHTIYTNPTTKSTACGKEMPKPLTSETLSNELFQNNCEPATDEYVDINDMEFIKKNSDSDKSHENILLRRSRRKKTTKRKDDDALLVVDKFVPSRALATLPTSYLYFDTSNGAAATEQTVFAKREIPLHMKFGPFVGETKTLNKHEIKIYRESNPHYPSLFLSHNSILDVSNENTSNWMRFVRTATKHREQNLLLCVINSQLYFKCCKLIAPKQELRVGYSKEYAQKYSLDQLLPRKQEKSNEYLCKNIDERPSSNEILDDHQNEQKTKETSVQSVLRTTPTKPNDSTSPNKGKDRLNTGKIRMRKLALSKKSRTSGPTVRYACCYCSKVFSKFLSYKEHTNAVHAVDIEHKRVKVDAEHKRLTIEDSVMKMQPLTEEKNTNGTKNWFVCQKCQRSFETAEKLEEHRLSNDDDKELLSTKCHICFKNLHRPSSLSMHLKKHESKDGLCKCPYCSETYQNTLQFRDHVKIHCQTNGKYKCPHCTKEFPKYKSIRKHIRINHTINRFVCDELNCGKAFKSKYKLKEHKLSHSDFREFSCADCDKQFKRKDKLREHILNFHSTEIHKNNNKRIENKPLNTMPMKLLEEEQQPANDIFEETNGHIYSDEKSFHSDDELLSKTNSKKSPTKQRFKPKVPPTEYERFIYKCQHCQLGFKRRGMLVNHLAKRHPDIRIDSIHELRLPILKTERLFYCQYCDKSYKSSSKRKAHIIKYHPGQKLPMSTRYNKPEDCENPMVPNPSFSANVGSITTNVHQCVWCYKQYASRSRLLQHKRKEHSKEIEDSIKQNQADYFKDLTHDLSQIMDSREGQFQQPQTPINQSIDEYVIKFNEIHEQHSAHRFQQIGYEPENRLLELSSAALETFRDDYSFLSDSDIEHSNIDGSRVDVNFKMVGDEFGQENSNCDLNSLPQLFEEIDCMTLKPSQYTTSSSTQVDSIIGKNVHLTYNK